MTGSYAPVNGLQMYYEIHSSESDRRPLVLLHGAYMSVASMGAVVPALARTRQVIGVEAQGHAHTGDADRPITYEGMADDTAALLRHIGIAEADVYGYSMGGGTALQLAIRHTDLVRKLVVVSAGYRYDGAHPEMYAMIETITPELFAGTPWEAIYKEAAPDPDAFPTLVEKLKQLDLTPFAWLDEDIRTIPAPTLLIVGDSDIVRLEHAVELFKLRGGVMADLAGLPASQLVILPGSSHLGILERVDWIVPLVEAFLDAPLPNAA
jgi:pimeloyl-ACP methyl ester carboxylesterase